MDQIGQTWFILSSNSNNNEDDECDSSDDEQNEFEKLSSNLLTNESDYLNNCMKNEFNSNILFNNENNKNQKIKRRWTKEEVNNLY